MPGHSLWFTCNQQIDFVSGYDAFFSLFSYESCVIKHAVLCLVSSIMHVGKLKPSRCKVGMRGKPLGPACDIDLAQEKGGAFSWDCSSDFPEMQHEWG